jgi:chloramphenicol O-acetyltransferase
MMKEILYILLDNYAEHEIGFLPGAVSTDATGFRMPISFQFHHVQMDGGHAARFLEELQKTINTI